jgi:predicted nucleic acid-binding protein
MFQKRHTSTTAKYIPNSYFDIEFIKMLKNQNLRKLYQASANSDEAEIWLQLAELGRNGAFTTNKTFEELARLMIQIKELEIAGKRKTGIRYSEHLLQFFSLVSEKSRTYEIFRQALAGANLPSIRQDIIIITNLNNILV